MSELIPYLETIATALDCILFVNLVHLFVAFFKSSTVTAPKEEYCVSLAKASKLNAEADLLDEQRWQLKFKKFEDES